jgi:hypothetical protein
MVEAARARKGEVAKLDGWVDESITPYPVSLCTHSRYRELTSSITCRRMAATKAHILLFVGLV